MQSLNSRFRRINLLPKQIKPNLSPFSSISDNHSMFNYLVETFNFSEQRAKALSIKYDHINSLEKPQSVVHFLQKIGFSQTHIISSVRSAPHILFSDIDKTLKPKIEFFQQLGLVGSRLGKLISYNSKLLEVSLEKRLIPNIEILRKILVNDKNNKDLIRVITKCSWLLSKDPKRRLLSNIEYLESCGIVGSRLLQLLKIKPRLFTLEECKLGELVSRTLDMGFLVNSGMFVHGLYTVGCMSEETIERKLQLFRSFGFSKDECMDMFRRKPGLLWASEEKLKLGLEFFLYKTLMKREVLFRNPVWLMYSLESRVIPRYEVLQILKLKRLLKKEPTFLHVLRMKEQEFLDKYVAMFGDDAEELLVAYKSRIVDSSSSASSTEEYLEENES